MRLFIAEKPSLARAIAAALPGPQQRAPGCIRCGSDVVTWCVGHLLEQVEPHDYNPVWKQWSLAALPIVPPQWKLKPRSGASEQLRHVKALVKEADTIVHAGDPDREGQLLVDEVFDHIRLSAKKKAHVQRLLINDLNKSAVSKSLSSLRNNSEFASLSDSALARSRADWLYGINMTRAWTLLGQQAGYQGVLSVGRVQTPLLGLVVRRDQEIEAFSPHPYYELDALLETATGERFTARWQPSEACAKWQDSDGRVLSRPLVENVAERIKEQPASILALEQQKKRELAPLPYSLSALQIDCARRYRMSASQVLDLAQKLYEKHQLITYPRSDCRYLPKGHWAEAGKVMSAVSQVCPELMKATQGADLGMCNRAWNDTKVDAHHAIIPTSKVLNSSQLSADELKVYQQIARHYIAQFYPDYRYLATQVTVGIGTGKFIARARQEMDLGWKALYRVERNNKEQATPTTSSDSGEQVLPPLKKGDNLTCLEGLIIDKMTRPPSPFSDASLLAAMTGIARYVKDKDIRRILREHDGIGTEATRAAIIEALFKRRLLVRDGKQIHASPAAKSLIEALPEEATQPDMTARWESELEQIVEGRLSYDAFMDPLLLRLRGLLEQSSQAGSTSLQGLAGQGGASKPRYQRKGSKSKKASSRTSAKKTFSKATNSTAEEPSVCPTCGKSMLLRKGNYGDFWGCSGYPGCRTTIKVAE